jgi:hypothetical protein
MSLGSRLGGRPGSWGLLAGLALIAVTNGWVLLDVARNRSGEPEARVELTERELWLPWSVEDDDEDSGLALTLAWHGDDPFGSGRPTWLDRDKLRELGFDVHVAPESPGSERFYSNVPAREAFVVLAMGGEAWNRELARREEEIRRCRQSGSCGPSAEQNRSVPEQVAELRRTESHLVAVDAGRDPRALRRRYPDRGRFLVLPAEVDVLRNAEKEGEPYLSGYLHLRVPRIHVPLPLRPVLDAVSQEDASRQRRWDEKPDPRYRAVLAVGRGYEPWLVRVERMPDATPPP